jgi:hypothetical protein
VTLNAPTAAALADWVAARGEWEGPTASAHSCAAWVVWRDGCLLDILESVVVFGWSHALVRRAESDADRSRDPFPGQAR